MLCRWDPLWPWDNDFCWQIIRMRTLCYPCRQGLWEYWPAKSTRMEPTTFSDVFRLCQIPSYGLLFCFSSVFSTVFSVILAYFHFSMVYRIIFGLFKVNLLVLGIYSDWFIVWVFSSILFLWVWFCRWRVFFQKVFFKMVFYSHLVFCFIQFFATWNFFV